VVGSCEHGNEPLGPIKGREFWLVEQLLASRTLPHFQKIYHQIIWTYWWWANLRRWTGRVKQPDTPSGSFNCRMSITVTSPEFEPTANIPLFDICQATDVNPSDPLFKTTETSYEQLHSKCQTCIQCAWKLTT
jgi:hypothetical protein